MSAGAVVEEPAVEGVAVGQLQGVGIAFLALRSRTAGEQAAFAPQALGGLFRRYSDIILAGAGRSG